MSFDVAADAYDRFMGRYSRVLSPVFADFVGVRTGQRVLDVGCGPGALTTELVHRLGPASVAAVDPSEPSRLRGNDIPASTSGAPRRRTSPTRMARSTS